MIPNRPAIYIRFSFFLMALAILLIANVARAKAQDSQPTWKLQKDDAFDVTLMQSTKITSQVDQRVKDVDNQLTLNMTWNVKSVSDAGNATIEMTIVSVQMTMESMPNAVGKSIEIDTASEAKLKGASAELLKQLNPLMGSVVEFEMSPRGEITNVVVPEATFESLRKAPGSMKLRSLLSSEGIDDLFGQSVVVLPEDLKLNQPWSITNQLKTGFGEFERTHTCTWTGNRKVGDTQLAEIELTTSVEPIETSAKVEAKLTSFSGGGNLVFDMNQGYFVSSKSTNEMNTEKPYREKQITTKVSTVVEMQIDKK